MMRGRDERRERGGKNKYSFIFREDITGLYMYMYMYM